MTQERDEALRLAIEYDPLTGLFRRIKRHSSCPTGWYAGTKATHGHLRLQINGKSYMAHRLAWVLTHGEWPIGIDHINGNPSDNRIANLRIATVAQNQHNQKRRIDNKSGLKGVHWHKDSGKWKAEIKFNGQRRSLGYFNDPKEAYAAYCAAASELHGQFARYG